MEYNVKRLPHGYLVQDSANGFEEVAAFSNFDDLAFWLNDKFRLTPTVSAEPSKWVDAAGDIPPFVDDTEIVVIWNDGTETHPQVFTSFASSWKSVAFWRITKGEWPWRPVAPNQDYAKAC